MQSNESDGESVALASLQKIMAKRGLKQADVARELGIGADIVSRWFHDTKRRKPSLETASKIQELYGIPAVDWTHEQKTGSAA